jgi:hypothetical protein
MNGFEYAAAIHMIMTGLVDEGMECVAAIRLRYDGERRNPWNEFECGSNYARSMAAYALLNAFSGFRFDMARGYIGFRPLQMANSHFRAFWSLAPGWGEIEVRANGAILRLLSGELALKTLELPIGGNQVKSTHCNGRPVQHRQEGETLIFSEALSIRAGEALAVDW